MQRVRLIHSIGALRGSGDVANVRLERKLRYHFEKLKAKGLLRFLYRHSHVLIPDASMHISALAEAATGSSHDITVKPPTPAPTSAKHDM